MNKRLFRSRTDQKIAGVLGGLARYLGMDASIVRIIYALLLIMTGVMPLGLVYLIGVFVIPYEDQVIRK